MTNKIVFYIPLVVKNINIEIMDYNNISIPVNRVLEEEQFKSTVYSYGIMTDKVIFKMKDGISMFIVNIDRQCVSTFVNGVKMDEHPIISQQDKMLLRIATDKASIHWFPN